MRPQTVPLALLMVASAVLLPLSACDSAAQPVRPGAELSHIALLQDSVNGSFVHLDPGQTVFIRDEVRDVYYSVGEDKTLVWTESTRGTPYANQTLVFRGHVPIQLGDSFNLTAVVVPSDAGEAISYTRSDLHFIKAEEERDLTWLERLVYDNVPSGMENQWTIFGVVLIIGLVLLFVIVIMVHYILRFIVHRTTSVLDDQILDLVERPVILLVILYVISVALRSLTMAVWIGDLIVRAYRVTLILVVTWLLVKVLHIVITYYENKYASKTETEIDDIMLPIAEKVGKVVLVSLGLVYALQAVGFDVTVFIAGMGIIGLVVAFAAQSTFSNFFGGIQLMLDRPFKKGDIILMEGSWYRVVDVGIRSTNLYDLFTHCNVVMPNNVISNEKVVNLSGPDRRIKSKVLVGVSYASDVQKVTDILMGIAENHPNVIHEEDHHPYVRFREFGDSALVFQLGYWVDDIDNMYRVASEIHYEIFRRFKEEGIEIPFPQRDLHLKEGWEKLGLGR